MKTNIPNHEVLENDPNPAGTAPYSRSKKVSILLAFLMIVLGLVQNADAQISQWESGVFTIRYSNGVSTIGWCDRGASGSIVIPSEVTHGGNVFTITGIERGAFQDCISITGITIPSTVTSIGASAFNRCTSLTSIDIPSSVTSIGEYAFADCTSLPSIDIPSSVTSIGGWTFFDCTSLTSITIPSSVTSIGDDAFTRCTSLTSIAIPSSVTSIGDEAFSRCTSLTSIDIPSSVTSIGEAAFADCTSLTSISIPSSVTSIGDGTFYRCTSLTSIDIPSSVTSIGGWTFFDCDSLTSITIPSSVTIIGEWAFSDCTSLTIIDLPTALASIGEWAFYNCTSLNSISIPSNVTSIGNNAFWFSNLTSCLFLGSAPPSFGTDVFPFDIIISLSVDSKGFTTPTWNGYLCRKLFGFRVALVTKLKGNVSVIRDGTTMSLTLGDTVYLGDIVKTETRSFSQLTFPDKSNMNIGPKSTMTVQYDIESPRPTLYLLRGELRFDKSPGKKIFIKTKTASIGVRGTALTVSVSEENGMLTTTTEVLEGVIDHENLATGEILELRGGGSLSSQSALATHTLTINHAPASGTLSINGTEITSFPVAVNHPESTEIELEVIPNPTVVFSGWSGDIISTNSAYTLFLEEDTTLTTNFLAWTDYASKHPALNPNEDKNGNGSRNFLDYASGQNPEATGTLPIVELGNELLTFRQRINSLDATSIPEYSENLSDWYTLEEGIHYTVISRTSDGEMLTIVGDLVPDFASAKFFRQNFVPR